MLQPVPFTSFHPPVARTFHPQSLGVTPTLVRSGEHVRLELQGFGGQLLTVRIIRTVAFGPAVSLQQFTAPLQDKSDVAIATVDELTAGYYLVRVYCHGTRTNHQISLTVLNS